MQKFTQFWQSFEQAWNTRDVSTLARHFDEEAQFTFIDGTKFSGRAAIVEFYRTAFARMPRDWVHYTVTKEEAESSLSGSVRIFSPGQRADVMRASYQLERSPRGLIRQLVLTSETKA